MAEGNTFQLEISNKVSEAHDPASSDPSRMSSCSLEKVREISSQKLMRCVEDPRLEELDKRCGLLIEFERDRPEFERAMGGPVLAATVLDVKSDCFNMGIGDALFFKAGAGAVDGFEFDGHIVSVSSPLVAVLSDIFEGLPGAAGNVWSSAV
jgi:hypothetical protein